LQPVKAVPGLKTNVKDVAWLAVSSAIIGNVGIGGRLALDKAWLEALSGAIHLDVLQQEEVLPF